MSMWQKAMSALCRVSGGRFARFRRPDINSCRSKSNLPMLFVRWPILLCSTVADSQLDASRLIRYQENNHSAKKKAPIIKRPQNDVFHMVHSLATASHPFTSTILSLHDFVKREFWNLKNHENMFCVSIKQ